MGCTKQSRIRMASIMLDQFESKDLWEERQQQKNRRRQKFEKKKNQKASKLYKLDELEYFNRNRQNGTH